MTIHDFGSGTLLLGDCRDGLRWMKEQGIKANMVCSSPPYWRQKDYGHEGQIGLEETMEEYLNVLIEVFMLVHEILADDGTIWINVDDVYNKTGGSGGDYNSGGRREGQPRCPGRNVPWLKQKELCGIPWRLAFALQECGWYFGVLKTSGSKPMGQTQAATTSRTVHTSLCCNSANLRPRIMTWVLPGKRLKHRRRGRSGISIKAKMREPLSSDPQTRTVRLCGQYGSSRPRIIEKATML